MFRLTKELHVGRGERAVTPVVILLRCRVCLMRSAVILVLDCACDGAPPPEHICRGDPVFSIICTSVIWPAVLPSNTCDFLLRTQRIANCTAVLRQTLATQGATTHIRVRGTGSGHNVSASEMATFVKVFVRVLCCLGHGRDLEFVDTLVRRWQELR